MATKISKKKFRYQFWKKFPQLNFSDTGSETFSRYLIFLIPVPRLFSVRICSDTSSDTTKNTENSRYREFPVPVRHTLLLVTFFGVNDQFPTNHGKEDEVHSTVWFNSFLSFSIGFWIVTNNFELNQIFSHASSSILHICEFQNWLASLLIEYLWIDRFCIKIYKWCWFV